MLFLIKIFFFVIISIFLFSTLCLAEHVREPISVLVIPQRYDDPNISSYQRSTSVSYSVKVHYRALDVLPSGMTQGQAISGTLKMVATHPNAIIGPYTPVLASINLTNPMDDQPVNVVFPISFLEGVHNIGFYYVPASYNTKSFQKNEWIPTGYQSVVAHFPNGSNYFNFRIGLATIAISFGFGDSFSQTVYLKSTDPLPSIRAKFEIQNRLLNESPTLMSGTFIVNVETPLSSTPRNVYLSNDEDPQRFFNIIQIPTGNFVTNEAVDYKLTATFTATSFHPVQIPIIRLRILKISLHLFNNHRNKLIITLESVNTAQAQIMLHGIFFSEQVFTGSLRLSDDTDPSWKPIASLSSAQPIAWVPFQSSILNLHEITAIFLLNGEATSLSVIASQDITVIKHMDPVTSTTGRSLSLTASSYSPFPTDSITFLASVTSKTELAIVGTIVFTQPNSTPISKSLSGNNGIASIIVPGFSSPKAYEVCASYSPSANDTERLTQCVTIHPRSFYRLTLATPSYFPKQGTSVDFKVFVYDESTHSPQTSGNITFTSTSSGFQQTLIPLNQQGSANLSFTFRKIELFQFCAQYTPSTFLTKHCLTIMVGQSALHNLQETAHIKKTINFSLNSLAHSLRAQSAKLNRRLELINTGIASSSIHTQFNFLSLADQSASSTFQTMKQNEYLPGHNFSVSSNSILDNYIAKEQRQNLLPKSSPNRRLKFSIWAETSIDFGSLSSNGETLDMSTTISSGMVGLDTAILQSLHLGIASGITKSSIALSSDGSYTNLTTMDAIIYGAWRLTDQTFLNSSLSLGRLQANYQRPSSVTTALVYGQRNGYYWSISSSITKDSEMQPWKIAFIPYVRGNVQPGILYAYSEIVDNELYTFDAINTLSYIVAIGARLRYFLVSPSINILPFIRGEYSENYSQGFSQTAIARDIPGSIPSIIKDSQTSEQFFSFSLGTRLQTNDTKFVVDGEYALSSSVSGLEKNHSFRGRLHINF